MKRLALVCLFLVSLVSVAISQRQEKEILYTGEGKITLEDGQELSGEITHSRITQRTVTIKNEKGTSKYKTKEVKRFNIGQIEFEKIETAYIGGKEPDFAIVLSNINSAVRVYEVCWQEEIVITIGNDTGNGWPTHREYYVTFPSIGKPKALADIAFMPFAKKVSKLVEDCPTLSSKIASKEKGYSLSLVATDEAKIELFVKIANEYAACKQ